MELKYKTELISGNGGHTYIVDGNDNELYTGVSSILNVRAKEFMKWWTAKMVVEFLRDKQETIKSLSAKDYELLLDEAKKAHTKKSNKAKDSGKLAHDAIETYIKIGEIKKIEDIEAQKAFDSFLKWEKTKNIKWLESELAVASKVYQYGGTIDAICEINGEKILLDFKTSNQFSEETFLQLAAYQLALSEQLENPKDLPIKRIILRIPKDGSDCEELIVPTELKFDIDTFLNLRQVYRWNLNIENNIKKDGKIKI